MQALNSFSGEECYRLQSLYDRRRIRYVAQARLGACYFGLLKKIQYIFPAARIKARQ